MSAAAKGTDPDDLVNQAARCLLNAGVVLLPTDTVFGLAALPSQPHAVARIFELKTRPSQRNLPVMISSVRQLEEIGAQISDQARRLIDSPFCPGPLSIAVGLRRDQQPEWLKGRDELAFRIPKDKFLLKLIDLIGPLLVTSANRHGMGTLGSADAAVAQLAGMPDLIVEGRECGSMPSTLVNCRHSTPKIERLGVVTSEELAPYLAS